MINIEGKRIFFDGKYRTIRLGQAIDPDFQLVLDYAVTEAITIPNRNGRQAMSRFFKDMKDADLFDILDIMLNSTWNDVGLLNFAKLDLKRVGTQTTFNGGFTYAVRGFQGDGINAYWDYNYNPAVNGVNFTLNDAGKLLVMTKIENVRIGNDWDGLVSGVQNRTSPLITGAGTTPIRLNQGTTNIDGIGTPIYIGSLGVARPDSATMKVFNNASEFTSLTASTSVPNSGACGLRTASIYTNSTLGFVAHGASFTFAQYQLFKIAYNRFLSSIGLPNLA